MPRERKGITIRKSGISEEARFIVIASEGADTERIYFEALSKELTANTKLKPVRIEFLDRGNQKGKNPKEKELARTKSGHQDVIKQLDVYKKKYNLTAKDELWLILDRDKNNNPTKNISDIVTKCKQKKYNLAISTPNFEFWLLLHLKDIETYTENELKSILENQNVSKSRTFLMQEIAKHLGSAYHKSKYDTKIFMQNINVAVKQAEKLDTLDRWHEDILGTKIHLLIKNIL